MPGSALVTLLGTADWGDCLIHMYARSNSSPFGAGETLGITAEEGGETQHREFTLVAGRFAETAVSEEHIQWGPS